MEIGSSSSSMSKKKKAYFEIVLEAECPKIPVKCKGCKKEFLSTTILRHLGRKKSCKDFYQQGEFDSMKEKAKLRKWAKVKSWQNKNYPSLKNGKRSTRIKENLKSIEEELSEYKKIRLANIEENQTLLQEYKSKNKM